MTHSIDAPFPPPATTGTGAPSTTQKAQETKEVAVEEARNVGQTAAQAGSQVASTATDQAKEVVQETQRQAKDLLEQGRSQLKEQTLAQQQKAAQGLSSLAQELRGLADGSSQGAPGPARDLLQQASGMVEQFADRLQNREPAQLLDEVRNFARRKPGMFLLGAAAAGILAGRLTSGMKAAHSGSSDGMRRDTGTGANYVVDPAPMYVEETYVEATVAPARVTGTTAGTAGTTGSSGTPGAAPLPPPPYGTVPPEGSVVPPTAPAGWEDPARRQGGVG
jgi:hypothetical protein